MPTIDPAPSSPPSVTLPAVPRGFVPVPAADFMGYRPMASEAAAAPNAVADLQVFTEYRAMLGIAAPDASQLAQRLTAAAQWTSLLARSSAWTRYVQSQEGVAWKDALELLQKLKVPFRLAAKAAPSLLLRYPALARLLGASSVVANRAAATRKKRKRAAAAPVMTTHEGVARSDAPSPAQGADFSVAHPVHHVALMRRKLPSAVGVAVCLAACGGSTANIGSGVDGGAGVDGGLDSAAVGDGATQVLDCQPDGGATDTADGDPGVQDTLHGTNGVFTDACDAQSNLVDYSCELQQTCGPGPNPDCTQYETGKVVSASVDCAGHCVDGRCDSRCPTESQRLTFTAAADAAGNLAIHNDNDGRDYVCTVVFDNPDDSFDCTTGPHAGLQGAVTGRGLHGDWCTGKDFGNVAVSVDGEPSATNENCAFGCGIAP